MAAGVGTPVLDAKLLAQYAFGFDAAQLAAREHEAVADEGLSKLEGLVLRRLQGEPVARIFGSKEFYGLTVGLNADTLVPRPETELLVDLGRRFLAERSQPVLADLGTGSGCIALALLHACPDALAVGVDVSASALAQAQINAEHLHLSQRFSGRAGSWLSPFSQKDRFDLIVSNPPYIESDAIAHLDDGVRLYDPSRALDGGPDGLAPYRVIAHEAKTYLKPDGAVMVEVGIDQASDVAALLRANGFTSIALHKDLAGIDRVVVAHCQPIA